MKKEGAPAEIGGEGAHDVFFQQTKTHWSAHSPQERKPMQRITIGYCNSCSGIFE